MDGGVKSPSTIPTDPFISASLRCAIDVNTLSVRPAEQYDLYRSWHSSFIEVELLRDKFDAFPARERVWQLGSIALACIEYPGTGYHRRWSSRKNPVFDHWLLSVPWTSSRRNETGRLRWQCLAAPHHDEGEDDGVLCLFLPRDFGFANPTLEIRPESAAFVAEFIVLLYRALPDLKEGDAPHIVSAAAALFAAALAPSNDHLAAARGPANAVSAARIAKVVSERLTDPDLTPGKLCRAVGVSRSRLYRLFEPAGGVSNYMRRKRLLKTRDALADNSDRRAISTIAEEWGFTDPSTFSRMFKAEFGMPPKEARELGWQGLKHSAWLRVDQPMDEAGTLGNLLINNSLGLSLSPGR